ncbi:carbohydrate ABC transporter permease [Nonomuraea angiospora]|uniref:Multiple sugar transport system permease protein n=1 Tax=Nonomuraea angiospora TaxID=46172 RepID=A0ABR9MCA7_9ACTN|nr:sugar ABC transporter permease [Nonomuraea angiospora]MBE1590543.1 multiple sugar transport system permease protein [Nonomuraea angiospora]MDX3102566.1 sugar ABC transporter permease [Nonomuraea angiospora]
MTDATIPPTTQRSRGVVRWVRRGGLSTLIFFIPLLASFGLFSWWPILRSLLLSLQRTNFLTSEWVGLDNFARVLRDPLLLTATWNTLWFAILAFVIGFPVPVILAVFIGELRRARRLASALVYLPVIFPPVVAVLLWKAFFDPSPQGVFNTVLGWFDIGPVPWLNSGDLAMPSIVLQATWASFGTATIIYLATLMSIQTELYDAAEADGAAVSRRFWHITLPQMRGVLLVMFLLQVIGTFQVFTEPYIMTNGGPENRTVTILMLIYRYAFISGDYGRATALSVLLAIVLSALSAVYLWATRRWSTS